VHRGDEEDAPSRTGREEGATEGSAGAEDPDHERRHEVGSPAEEKGTEQQQPIAHREYLGRDDHLTLGTRAPEQVSQGGPGLAREGERQRRGRVYEAGGADASRGKRRTMAARRAARAPTAAKTHAKAKASPTRTYGVSPPRPATGAVRTPTSPGPRVASTWPY